MQKALDDALQEKKISDRRLSVNSQKTEPIRGSESKKDNLLSEISQSSSKIESASITQSSLVSKLALLASPMMSRSASSKFSSLGMDKKALSLLSTTDTDDTDDEDSFHPSVRQRRKSRRKRFSSHPHLNRHDIYSDFLGSSVSIGDLGENRKGISGAEETNSCSVFPDIIPFFADPIPDQSQEELAKVITEPESRYSKTLEKDETVDDNKELVKTSKSSEKGYTSGESYIYDGVIKLNPFRVARSSGETFCRIRSDPKMIFQEQKKLRKSQIYAALQNELYNLQSLKLGTSYTSEGKVVKRFAQEYNRRIAEFVGVRTYTGSFTFQSLENHIMEQQGLLNRKTSIITRTQSEGYITPTFERYNPIYYLADLNMSFINSQ